MYIANIGAGRAGTGTDCMIKARLAAAGAVRMILLIRTGLSTDDTRRSKVPLQRSVRRLRELPLVMRRHSLPPNASRRLYTAIERRSGENSSTYT